MTTAELEKLIAEKVKEIQNDRGTELSDDMKEYIATAVKEAVAEDKTKNGAGYEAPPEETIDPKGGFKNITEFARAVKLADTGKSLDKRLADLDPKNHKAAGSPTLEEGDPAAGGHLIPTEFRNQILERVESRNPVYNRAMEIPMQTSSIDIPALNGFDESDNTVHGGIKWYWTQEKNQLTATRPDLDLISLKLKTVAGLCYVTDQMLEDSPISMEMLLNRGFSDGIVHELMRVFLKGNGVGQPQGITNAKCKVAVAKQGGQKADTIVFENIVDMIARAYGEEDFVWMINKQCLPQICTMSLVVGTGGVPVFLPANGAAGQPFPTLFGYPIVWTKHCKKLGDEGDIILADWSQYLIGRKSGGDGGVKMGTSIHLKFDYMQTAYRFSMRVDGQPWWPQAYVGPESDDSLSPFVTLAARA